jgi:hypothetical protein
MPAAPDFINRDRSGKPVVFDISHDDDFTFGDHLAVRGACIVRGTFTAPTQCLHLERMDAVCEFDEPGRSLEEMSAEVGQDAEGEDVDRQFVDDFGQLFDLPARAGAVMRCKIRPTRPRVL